MVRFHFKQSKNEGEAGVNAKVLKDVKFPVMLDMHDMCSPELKEKIKPRRTEFKEYEDWWFEDDVGSSNSGYYILQAVLTHKGRSSNSGHYVGWVRQQGENWLKCDDDDVSPIHEEDVLKLSGGGDWHTAYLLLYGPRKLPKVRGQASESSTPAAAE